MEAYNMGERDFGESRVQELVDKYQRLPKDIRWHMIGHLQTNKVRQIIPFVHLIQSVDSLHLLEVIEAEGARQNRVVNILLEVHVARELTKSGFSVEELQSLFSDLRTKRRSFSHVQICGLMTMATHTEDEQEIRRCFQTAKKLLTDLPLDNADLSMGMSDDYQIAIEEGSTMVRIGSSIFGERVY